MGEDQAISCEKSCRVRERILDGTTGLDELDERGDLLGSVVGIDVEDRMDLREADPDVQVGASEAVRVERAGSLDTDIVELDVLELGEA